MSGGRLARLADAALEATVVGSFTKIGPALRRRSDAWAPLSSRPGRRVLLTGASSGLGRASAVRLGGLGMELIIVARRSDALDEVAAEVEAAGGRAVPLVCDLADLGAVEGLAAEVSERWEEIDVLIHNAGAMMPEHRLSPQGHESTVALSLLGPHLLTERLRPRLESADRAKVLTMTSGGMYAEAFDLGSLEMGPDAFRPSVAYARAKRAQVVWTVAQAQREPSGGIGFSAVHPGWAATPGVASSLPTFDRLLGPLLRSSDEGADCLCWLASLDAGEPEPGGLWLDRRRRGLFHLPTTRVSPATLAEQGRALLAWLEEITGA